MARRTYKRYTTSAAERVGSQKGSWTKLARTVVLGSIALTLGIFWLGDQYGVDRAVMVEFLITSAAFVGLVVVAAAAGAFLIRFIRKLLRKDG